MGKFAVRGLAQSLARELSPKGIHVAHFVIDGAVKTDAANDAMTADAIAQTGASGPQGMGQVMKLVTPQTAGKADGGLVSGLVKAALTGGN